MLGFLPVVDHNSMGGNDNIRVVRQNDYRYMCSTQTRRDNWGCSANAWLVYAEGKVSRSTRLSLVNTQRCSVQQPSTSHHCFFYESETTLRRPQREATLFQPLKYKKEQRVRRFLRSWSLSFCPSIGSPDPIARISCAETQDVVPQRCLRSGFQDAKQQRSSASLPFDGMNALTQSYIPLWGVPNVAAGTPRWTQRGACSEEQNCETLLGGFSKC